MVLYCLLKVGPQFSNDPFFFTINVFPDFERSTGNSLDRPVRTFSRLGDKQRALFIQRAINKGEKPLSINPFPILFSAKRSDIFRFLQYSAKIVEAAHWTAAHITPFSNIVRMQRNSGHCCHPIDVTW